MVTSTSMSCTPSSTSSTCSSTNPGDLLHRKPESIWRLSICKRMELSPSLNYSCCSKDWPAEDRNRHNMEDNSMANSNMEDSSMASNNMEGSSMASLSSSIRRSTVNNLHTSNILNTLLSSKVSNPSTSSTAVRATSSRKTPTRTIPTDDPIYLSFPIS